MSGLSSLPIIGVMGSGTREFPNLSEPLGAWIARAGCHLLTGGGGGVMQAVARSFVAEQPRDGLSIGVLPSMPQAPAQLPSGYPNAWVELPIRTHLPARGLDGGELMSRNHINVLSSDVVVILPGGAGTRSEAVLACGYARPAYCLGMASDFESFPAITRYESVSALLTVLAPYARRSG